jgi:TolA-binding protein
MNGASSFTIDKATIVGGNNTQGQPSPAIFNIFGSPGVEERSRSPGWERYLEVAFKHQTATMAQKERELKERENQLSARELKVEERERLVEEQERTVAQLVQSLKKLEGELQQRRSADSAGDGPQHGRKVRLGGRKYGEHSILTGRTFGYLTYV